MRRWMGLAIGAMLAISLLGVLAQPVRATDFTITYNDLAEYPAKSNVDIKSLTSAVVGSDILITLKTWGDISTASDYTYMVSAGDAETGGAYTAIFSMAGSSSVLTMVCPTDSDMQMNAQTIMGNTLTFSFPVKYTGPAASFDITATASYMGTSVFDWVIDSAGGEKWAAQEDYVFTGASSQSVPGTDTDSLSGTGEYNVYRVTLSSGLSTTFALDGPAGSNFDLFLFDSSESEVWSSVSNGADETFTYSVGGTYYLVVDSVSGSGTYTLTITTAGGSSSGFEKKTPTSVPWTSGDYAASGAYLDLADMIDEMKTNLTNEMPDELKVSFSGAGGIGQYILVEYVGEDGGNYKFDYSCRIYGALAVDGKMTADNADMDGTTVDGTVSGKADVTGDLLYEGSLWLGYYENTGGKAYWAGEKMTLNIVASLDLSANMDANIKAEGVTVKGSMDASANVDMDIQLTFESTPGIPFMPAKDESISVERTCVVTYTGDVKFDMVMDMTATGYFDTMMGEDITIPDPVHFDNSASGRFENTFSLDYNADTNKAAAPPLFNGGWAMIENVNEIDLSGIGGTRSTSFETTATYDASKGMYTTYDPYFGPADEMLGGTEIPFVGDIPTDTSSMDMTLEPVDKADAESFNDNPSAFLEDEGVAMPGSSFPWLIVVLAIVAVAVVVVLVLLMMMMKKKKAAKFNQHPAPYQGQPYGQQPYQQQPPQQPPQGQYPPYQPPQEQYPPQQPPQQYPPQ